MAAKFSGSRLQVELTSTGGFSPLVSGRPLEPSLRAKKASLLDPSKWLADLLRVLAPLQWGIASRVALVIGGGLLFFAAIEMANLGAFFSVGSYFVSLRGGEWRGIGWVPLTSFYRLRAARPRGHSRSVLSPPSSLVLTPLGRPSGAPWAASGARVAHGADSRTQRHCLPRLVRERGGFRERA